ncbi:MAG TPA: molybdate ABC transporter substrate-binding protein [Pyrinomonadaceae bacterium]|nr:molybdate ABC transporter substrate-binding protein [Pyrinomonadaceae bacterium]
MAAQKSKLTHLTIFQPNLNNPPVNTLTRVSRTIVIAVLLILQVVFSSNCRSKYEQNGSSELTVAAAADLTPAFEEIGTLFQDKYKVKIIYTFGSTGMLAQQIENGAPVDIFAAANVSYVEQIESKGLIISGSKAIYARGRITIWVPKESSIKIEAVKDLTRDDVKRIAIANPDHAPYGMAAREAFASAGILSVVQPKLVYAENIRQTLQYAQTGNVEVAIVALSLSKQSDGRWTLIPEELHKPLNQALAIIKGTKNEVAARQFSEFVRGPEGRAVLSKYGFEFPGN